MYNKPDNTDYLRFNAFAIKDLIVRKLSQDSNFTDQVYTGSNLTTLIDIIAYMYQTLMFNLNKSASESMWSDTQLYENINRLSYFLGYNPHGMNPSMVIFSFPLNQLNNTDTDISYNKSIPRYSYIQTDKVDSYGNNICFSTVEDIALLDPAYSDTQEITLYSGKWRLYDRSFVASGDEWETFVLTDLRSDSDNGEFVAHNYIHVYVEEPESSSTESSVTNRISRYNMTDAGLFKSRNDFFNKTSGNGEITIPKIYTSTDKVFSLRLNENKEYVITFGDGQTGRRLTPGSTVYVFYLDSYGTEVELQLNEITGTLQTDFTLQNSTNTRNLESNVYKKILAITSNDSNYYVTDPIEDVENISTAIGFSPEESVDEIRDFAPAWFRMGNRLVTKYDYEYYLRNSFTFRDVFADVVIQNNWEYMSTFYKWLYEKGALYNKKHENGLSIYGNNRFLRQDNLLKTSRQYADAADSNNIYIWIVPEETGDLNIDDTSTWIKARNDWKNVLLPIKDLTHEPYFIPGVFVKFALCATDDHEYIMNNYLNNSNTLNQKVFRDNYIEITLSDNVVYSGETLQQQIRDIIKDFFKSSKQKFGTYVDYGELQRKIMDLGNIERIRTVFLPEEVATSQDSNLNNIGNNQIIIKNGLSFMSYTDDALLKVRNGFTDIDLETGTSGRMLEPFQFPRSAMQNLDDIKITLIKRINNTLNRSIIY